MEKITVLIVDDSSTIRETLKSLLRSPDDIEVVGMASCGYEAVSMAEALEPTVVLMDAQMPEMDGAEATRRIKSLFPEIKVLFLAVHMDHADDATEAGADGLMMKDDGRHKLIQHIRRVAGRICTP